MTISELKAEIIRLNLSRDVIGIEQTFVEGYSCRRCYRTLNYQGFEAANGETTCYGVCEKCDYARKFYFNSPRMAAVKRRFSKAKV